MIRQRNQHVFPTRAILCLILIAILPAVSYFKPWQDVAPTMSNVNLLALERAWVERMSLASSTQRPIPDAGMTVSDMRRIAEALLNGVLQSHQVDKLVLDRELLGEVWELDTSIRTFDEFQSHPLLPVLNLALNDSISANTYRKGWRFSDAGRTIEQQIRLVVPPLENQDALNVLQAFLAEGPFSKRSNEMLMAGIRNSNDAIRHTSAYLLLVRRHLELKPPDDLLPLVTNPHNDTRRLAITAMRWMSPSQYVHDTIERIRDGDNIVDAHLASGACLAHGLPPVIGLEAELRRIQRTSVGYLAAGALAKARRIDALDRDEAIQQLEVLVRQSSPYMQHAIARRLLAHNRQTTDATHALCESLNYLARHGVTFNFTITELRRVDTDILVNEIMRPSSFFYGSSGDAGVGYQRRSFYELHFEAAWLQASSLGHFVRRLQDYADQLHEYSGREHFMFRPLADRVAAFTIDTNEPN